jgi:hypothetical protein
MFGVQVAAGELTSEYSRRQRPRRSSTEIRGLELAVHVSAFASGPSVRERQLGSQMQRFVWQGEPQVSLMQGTGA